MEINYDEILSKTIDEEEINYGIIYGNEKIVFIKVGADGNIRGYKCKYLKMACKVHESLGATVVCASNPFIEQGHLEADEAIITKIASQINCCDYEVYFVGTSDGAHHNLALAKKVPQTVKILSINTSMVDLQDLKDRLYELPKIKKILVYGTKDELFHCVPSLENMRCDNLEVKVIHGADHEFKGMLEEYISLIDLL